MGIKTYQASAWWEAWWSPKRVNGAVGGRRQATNVLDLWKKWTANPTTTQRGGEPDYEAFAQQFGLGQQAITKLRNYHQQGIVGRKDSHLFIASENNLLSTIGNAVPQQMNDRDHYVVTLHVFTGKLASYLHGQDRKKALGAASKLMNDKTNAYVVAQYGPRRVVFVPGGGGTVLGDLSTQQGIVGSRDSRPPVASDKIQQQSLYRHIPDESPAWARDKRYERPYDSTTDEDFRKAVERQSRRKQACWPGCHNDPEHVRKYHKKKEGQRKEATDWGLWGDHYRELFDRGQWDQALQDLISDGYEEDRAKQLLQEARQRGQHVGHKTAWSGWGPSVFPKTRQVTGWSWDDHLNGYIAHRPQKFACECGENFDTPTGYHRCKCGNSWNSYIVGAGGHNRESSIDKIIVRSVPVRENVIVANRVNDRRIAAEGLRRLTGPHEVKEGDWIVLRGTKQDWQVGKIDNPKFVPIHAITNSGRRQTKVLDQKHFDAGKIHKRATVTLIDPKTSRRFEMIDPMAEGEDDWPSDHHPDTPKIKSTPKDWAKRDQNQRWTPRVI